MRSIQVFNCVHLPPSHTPQHRHIDIVQTNIAIRKIPPAGKFSQTPLRPFPLACRRLLLKQRKAAWADACVISGSTHCVAFLVPQLLTVLGANLRLGANVSNNVWCVPGDILYDTLRRGERRLSSRSVNLCPHRPCNYYQHHQTSTRSRLSV